MFKGDSIDRVNVMVGEPKKALISMSIPLIISLLISSLYSLIDAMWVSGLGADALAGIGFIIPVFMILVGIGNGLSAGSASAISKYVGESIEPPRRVDDGDSQTKKIYSILFWRFLLPRSPYEY